MMLGIKISKIMSCEKYDVLWDIMFNVFYLEVFRRSFMKYIREVIRLLSFSGTFKMIKSI